MPPPSSDLPLSERSTGRDSLDKIGHVFLRELRPPQVSPCPLGPRFSRYSSPACLQRVVRAPSAPPPSPGAMMIARRLLRSNAPAQVIIHSSAFCPTLAPSRCMQKTASFSGTVGGQDFTGSHRLSGRIIASSAFAASGEARADFVWLL